jgi:hypothetical protein
MKVTSRIFEGWRAFSGAVGRVGLWVLARWNRIRLRNEEAPSKGFAWGSNGRLGCRGGAVRLLGDQAPHGPCFTISLKRSTQNLQLSTSSPADYPIF